MQAVHHAALSLSVGRDVLIFRIRIIFLKFWLLILRHLMQASQQGKLRERGVSS
jgi:hypothetical protein